MAFEFSSGKNNVTNACVIKTVNRVIARMVITLDLLQSDCTPLKIRIKWRAIAPHIMRKNVNSNIQITNLALIEIL